MDRIRFAMGLQRTQLRCIESRGCQTRGAVIPEGVGKAHHPGKSKPRRLWHDVEALVLNR